MQITEVKMEIMEDIFFSSSEFGNEYHSYGLIGNTALPYAFKLVESPYLKYKKPHHREDFKQLSDMGIYITPATFPFPVDFKLDRFNARPESYDMIWKDGTDEGTKQRKYTYPEEGWVKLIRKGNIAYCYILSEKNVSIPQYVRIGKFMSKIKITTSNIDFEHVKNEWTSDIVLRAEDIDPSINILQYDKIVIQHGTYLKNIVANGNGIKLHTKIFENAIIPENTKFYAVESG